MATTSSSTRGNGAKLVIGLLVLAVIVAVGLRSYWSSYEGESNILQQQGVSAARQGIGLSQEGFRMLTGEEQRELGALYDEALKSIRPEEKQRFLALAQKGTTASDQEIAESARLIEKALQSLPQEKRERLVNLAGKAAQLAQQKATAEKKPGGQ